MADLDGVVRRYVACFHEVPCKSVDLFVLEVKNIGPERSQPVRVAGIEHDLSANGGQTAMITSKRRRPQLLPRRNRAAGWQHRLASWGGAAPSWSIIVNGVQDDLVLDELAGIDAEVVGEGQVQPVAPRRDRPLGRDEVALVVPWNRPEM